MRIGAGEPKRQAGAYCLHELRHRLFPRTDCTCLQLRLAPGSEKSVFSILTIDNSYIAMNLRDLEYAVCLAGEGQFRRAAERPLSPGEATFAGTRSNG